MEPSVRSYSSMNSTVNNYFYRTPFSFEQIEYSSFISTLQLLINVETIFKKFSECSPSCHKLSGKIKVSSTQRHLINFKSNNYTGISTIAPASLNFSEQKPGFIFNKILEDFASCNEIPPNKRPDSLFLLQNKSFAVSLLFSDLKSAPVSELVVRNSQSAFKVIDVVYDQHPTCAEILNSLSNLSTSSLELVGLVSAHGCSFSAYLKSMEQWRGCSDGKMYSFKDLVWHLCTTSAYPVLVLFGSGKGSSDLSRSEKESIEKFCKKQDKNIKISIKAEPETKSAILEDIDSKLGRWSSARKSQETAKLNNEEISYKRVVQDLSKSDGRRSSHESRRLDSSGGLSTRLNESARPGILKNGESRFSRNNSSSPKCSPRDCSSSRFFREKFGEEVAGKAVLRTAWIERKPEIEKKVNFSEKVLQIDDSIRGQMPEIRLTAIKFRDNKNLNSPDYLSRQSERTPYKPVELLGKGEEKDRWYCPKCSMSIRSSSFECSNCRCINWDLFYSLKSSSAKTRAGSIPSKSNEKLGQKIENKKGYLRDYLSEFKSRESTEGTSSYRDYPSYR